MASPIDGSSLKYRNFLDDDKALRLTFMLNNSSEKYTYIQAGEQFEGVGDDPVAMHLELQLLVWPWSWLRMHFDGTDNLSPYFGFEGVFMSSKEKTTWSTGAN